ncbi:lyase family protein [Acidiplasma cupricumulans]|uniref:lyase family protein n=1 Tax=Acidiplasma cupricumulans TaxID=312540 RepID=UPI0007814B39|nr:lyase family protein [Acidiplasma cupricumulans]
METLLSFQKSILETVKVINNIRQDGVLPGYTHFRQAMPIRYSTYLNYISEIFTSAFYRLNDVFNDLLELPLGYGSGFGSVSGVDFGEVASYIGMKKILGTRCLNQPGILIHT